jgi:signal peptide peptidase SppA
MSGVLHRLPFIKQELCNAPLALHAGGAWLAGAVMANAPHGRAAVPARPHQQTYDPGYDVVQGVAVIKVSGLLVQCLGSARPVMGMTGYDGLRHALRNAVQAKNITRIVLDIDSPGGEVAGCFDLVDDIYAVRDEKPIRAILSENAYSAAYAIASATGRIYMPRTGGAGSIGIIAMVLDISGALQMAGVQLNVLTFGARKADGYPELPLSPAGRARFQNDVDTLGNLFAETVARNRGLRKADVLAFQARTFMGQDAVNAGLVDVIASPADALGQVVAAAVAQKRKVLAR